MLTSAFKTWKLYFIKTKICIFVGENLIQFNIDTEMPKCP